MGTTYSYLVIEETFSPSERCPHHRCHHRHRHRHRHYYRHHCHGHCSSLRHCHQHSCCGRHEREEITPKPGATIIHSSTAQPNLLIAAHSQAAPAPPPPPPPPAAAANRMFLVQEAPQERSRGMLVIPDGAEVHVKQKEKRADVLGLRGSDGSSRYLCDAEGRYLRADHEGWVWVQELGGHVWVKEGRVSQPPVCP